MVGVYYVTKGFNYMSKSDNKENRCYEKDDMFARTNDGEGYMQCQVHLRNNVFCNRHKSPIQEKKIKGEEIGYVMYVEGDFLVVRDTRNNNKIIGKWDGKVWEYDCGKPFQAQEKCESCLAGFSKEDVSGNCTCSPKESPEWEEFNRYFPLSFFATKDWEYDYKNPPSELQFKMWQEQSTNIAKGKQQEVFNFISKERQSAIVEERYNILETIKSIKETAEKDDTYTIEKIFRVIIGFLTKK